MRRGITVRVRLEEWDKMIIRPHEGILTGAKEDRQNLLWALKVNTSPVLMMYQDIEHKIAELLSGESFRGSAKESGAGKGNCAKSGDNFI